jgi:hypothetical protein
MSFRIIVAKSDASQRLSLGILSTLTAHLPIIADIGHMNDARFQLDLSEPLLRAVRDVAIMRDQSIAQVMRAALEAEVRRAKRSAKSPTWADEQHLAICRAKYAADFAYAVGWGDLMRRLFHKGAALREVSGGLAIHGVQSGLRICKASDVGASMSTLARRFKAPFPRDFSGFPHLHTRTTRDDESEVVK